MDDKKQKDLIQTIDTTVEPPNGLEEALLLKVLAKKREVSPILTPFERFLYEKPLRAACIISVITTGSIWAVMGSGFSKLLSSILI